VDSNALCLSRFSKYTRRFHRVPNAGTNPLEYLQSVHDILAKGAFDVFLPTHEQAFLIAAFKNVLPASVAIALAPFSSFRMLQSKVDQARALASIGIPQPSYQVGFTREEFDKPHVHFPAYFKLAYSSSSLAVWKVTNLGELYGAINAVDQGRLKEFGAILQESADGEVERTQAIFQNGQLTAVHQYRQALLGAGGGDAIKESVRRPEVDDCLGRIGTALTWHGALSFDYVWDAANHTPRFIDCNARLVEPINGLISGVDLTIAWLRAAYGAPVPNTLPLRGRGGIRTKLAFQCSFERVLKTGSRFSVVLDLFRQILNLGRYDATQEELHPFREDPLSAIPMLYILGRLILTPKAANKLITNVPTSYGLQEPAIRLCLQTGAAHAH